MRSASLEPTKNHSSSFRFSVVWTTSFIAFPTSPEPPVTKIFVVIVPICYPTVRYEILLIFKLIKNETKKGEIFYLTQYRHVCTQLLFILFILNGITSNRYVFTNIQSYRWIHSQCKRIELSLWTLLIPLVYRLVQYFCEHFEEMIQKGKLTKLNYQSN